MSLKIAKTVYLDASSALRWILNTPDTTAGFGEWDIAGSSVLFEVECCRTLERLLNERKMTPEQYAAAASQLQDLWDSMEKIPVKEDVIALAKQRFVAPMKTLDALHAASAQLWSRALDKEVMVISHDKKLNLIAKSLGLKTLESK
ncbi:type II toxin-antitoxin system VapC family toxin [Turneriella parva]|uniref:PIN domain-containing protein n=1 Tax=Turneriella parva (strain ATCC BAA-1111 / DSM 21527 / NCTC 11395 / H) TaxID=869212 RepID=I4B994_TURPD|nr:type II toxin-antitoxin system VapC family toxin [Turneriella parva]AFM13851.1 hypothetical protein Turpa_3212 [Turneriella parva DSM 21527]